jgi:peptidyl-dipeptidase Dcp
MNCENPLFELETCHHPLPFGAVRPEHYLPALDAALARARERVAAVAHNPDAPGFDNTVTALEAADEWADRISSLFYHLLHTDGGPELQALAKDIPPRLADFRNDVTLNPALFARFETLWENRAALGLDPEQHTVLENHVLHFRRNGAALPEADRQTLRGIDQRFSVCGPAFAENVLKATQAYALWIENEAIVAPLPETARAAAKAAARKDKRPDAWKFTLDAPSYIAFMTYCPDAALRRGMWQAYGSRCVDGEHANASLLREILDLRNRRAQLLGYPDHAAYVLERRMVGNLDTLRRFYDRLLPIVMPAARRDIAAVEACKADLVGTGPLQPWDYAFYAEKLKEKCFDLNQEELRPYFEFESTLGAVFALCRELFGLAFRPSEDLPVYHSEVRTFRVEESGGILLGYLWIDPFPRATKKPGAWMAAILGQGLWDGEVRRPDVGIVCNFTPPVDGAPSLLTLDEARTLFHEFGHALHELLSQCRYRSVAGTNVFWDFVELPSQLLENWLQEPEFLRRYARHHQSGEALPEVLIQRLRASQTFQKGYQAVRQLSFGLLDLAWHTTPPDQIGDDLVAFERAALRDVSLFPPHDGVAHSFSFQHIFSGGYAAGYYSYKWAEVLEADVFDAFRENGLFDPDTAQRLRTTLLSRGGSLPPMDLFRAFRGRDPNPDALLKRDGLV